MKSEVKVHNFSITIQKKVDFKRMKPHTFSTLNLVKSYIISWLLHSKYSKYNVSNKN